MGRMNRTNGMVAAALALAPCFIPTGAAQMAPAQVAELKGKMQVLQAVIDKNLEQTFTLPFGILEKTKGTYLSGFGLVFSVEVNLYPMRQVTPFSPQPYGAEELEQVKKKKLERIAVIKHTVPQLLADHGVNLGELRPEESVAVVVYLFHIQGEGEKLPTQIIVQVKKGDLDQFRANRISSSDLKARVKISEL